MNERIAFLREQTRTGANKCARTAVPKLSVADEPYSIPERKALALKLILDTMPLYIGPQELIVGTRTYFQANQGNEDNHDHFDYTLFSGPAYINEKDVELFGYNSSYWNKTHYTPDYNILLQNGVGGIIKQAQERMKDPTCNQNNLNFLSSVIIAYTGLQNLINRYAQLAEEQAAAAQGEEQARLETIAGICRKISTRPAETFYEALQLLWFGHLTATIESFEFINYGRLDVILYEYLKDTPKDKAFELLECLLLKMYDQADLKCTYLQTYSAQLVVTLGGVLPNGENAVNDVTMMFLDAIGEIRLPEPEFNLRVNSKNPPEFLDKAIELTISGCNHVSYYNDDLFIESLTLAGIPEEHARNYGFDLCQDMNIPGWAEFHYCSNQGMLETLLDFLKKNRSFDTFEELYAAYKKRVADDFKNTIEQGNLAQEYLFKYRDCKFDEYFDGIKNKGVPTSWMGRTPMSPIPYLSALFHGALETATDLVFEPYPIKEKGALTASATEAINSLAAIKKVVYETGKYTLEEVISACEDDYQKDGQEILRNLLWNAPKWGNDDDYVDSIAKDLLEFCLKECEKYETFSGGKILGGIHQPHPRVGNFIEASPEGRRAHTALAVTLTPESGTMRNGPTAALKSATKIDHRLIKWNFCVMVNYLASVFKGNNGKDVFKQLLTTYFANGGMQHQPNVLDVNTLKKAQLEPEKYKDLIVRLWGVSAHFVELSKEVQDEVIARYS